MTAVVEVPLAAAERRLQRMLLDAYERSDRPGLPRPAVATLGAANLLIDGDPTRMRANVHLSPQAVLIGPWGGDGSAALACGHCVGVRWQRLRGRSERDALETGSDIRSHGDWPLVTEFSADAVWTAYEAVMGAPAELPQVSCLDLATLRLTTYPILADPRCPSCRASGSEPPLTLQSRIKPGPLDFRLTRAEDHALPSAALVNPACGMLSAGTVMNIASPTTAPVSGSVFVRSYAGLIDMAWSGQANSFTASSQLALLEGLERYAGTHPRGSEPPVVDSYANLGASALNPADCGLYAPRTYREDPQVAPFDPDGKIPWVRGYSLRDDRPILVPRRLCYYSVGAEGDNFVFGTSSGSALGSCLEEAILFALLELIERDAFLLAWYGGAQLTEIDLASCRTPRLAAMIEQARLHGYDVHAFDNRIDLAVPVVTGLAVRRDGGPGALSFAAGASLDPELAVESALSEVLTYIPQLHRQTVRRWNELEAMASDYANVRQLVDHSGLFGLPRMREHAARYLDDPPIAAMSELYDGDGAAHADLLDDLRWVQHELVRAGHDVIVVDQSTPEQRWIGLRAVCAIVPGLLPIDFGWSRQRALRMPRLRIAYRRAGWRHTDLAEAEIRRVPHPFP